MATHQRQLIREAVRARLTGETGAEERVFETRIIPWRTVELPAVAVYALSESVDPESASTAPRELARTLQLAIEATAKVAEDMDDVLDSLAKEIEQVMHADETLGGVASDSILAGTEIMVDVDSDKPVGVARLTYSVTYYTPAIEPASEALDDLRTIDVKTSLEGKVIPANQAEDLLTNLDQ